jgi:Uri superfamily endonuclease
MGRPAKPDLKSLIGRTIKAVHQKYAPQEETRCGEWHVDYLTLDDGTEIAFVVGERECEYVVDLIHQKGKCDA